MSRELARQTDRPPVVFPLSGLADRLKYYEDEVRRLNEENEDLRRQTLPLERFRALLVLDCPEKGIKLSILQCTTRRTGGFCKPGHCVRRQMLINKILK